MVLVLLGGYVYLDIRDIVPGLLTTDEPWPDAEPFPTAQVPAAADLGAVAPGPDDAAPVPSTESLASLTAALLDDERAGPDPSVMVTDLLTGEVLLDENAGQLRAPASALKLLAAVAALETMGPEHTFPTRVVDGGVGQIVLVGGGDITLAADEGAASGPLRRGGLGDLAGQVAESLLADGTTQVTLSLDDTLFTGPLMGPNWTDGDRTGGWAMPIRPIAVDLGRQQGTNARQQDPAMAAAEMFAERLDERGVEVTEIERGSSLGETVLGEVTSAPLADLVAYTLQASDNPLAEVLGRMTAHAIEGETSFSGSGAAVLEVLEGLGVDVEGVSLADTSGLSSDSRVNARVLTEAVQLAASPEHPHLADAIRGMPVGALEGTLRDRLGGTAAAGALAAKTGTLPQVVSLTGMVHTADGRVLAFTVLTGDFERGAAYLARLTVDDWASRIADCGC
ncbi:D-alanyl-D-alanine carboxypeptidase/D-alanyl-D-alanine endopeptidase [Pseudactinotalea sp. Z1732]|uniref:D-alanyl-D-alanine carboxypeptidase/D-alanyl-D-alanine endopeptidase n=1 Tax=Pseudactinotalea sp. Z1732 TaxID=3413026 RepID=UPI003C7C5567